MSPLATLPKRAITIWQGWRKQLWISSSAGCNRQRRVPLPRFSTKLKWSYKLLDVVFTGSKRLFQLPRPHLRCENEEGKKQSAGQNMHVHILLLHSFCSSNYSSLARERGFSVNMRLQTFLLMFEVAFLLEITMMNFRFCHQNSA